MFANTVFASRGHASLSAVGGRLISLVFLALALSVFVSAGCSTNSPMQAQDQNAASLGAVTATLTTEVEPDGFAIEAKYYWIQSNCSGGGLYIIRLVPGENFDDNVTLDVSAHPMLNAEFTSSVLNRQSPITELIIHPSVEIEPTTHDIEVTATHAGTVQTILLQVNVISNQTSAGGCAEAKRDDFISWLNETHPELGGFTGENWFRYLTYGPVKIVEHWTFLNQSWEMRVDLHASWGEDLFYYMRLRSRNVWDPLLAAKEIWDGTTFEIPISDYPLLYNY